MDRTAVTSSNIRSIGYDPATKTLEIEFPSGVYSYPNVPLEAYEGLKNAKSIGSYFSAQIRGKFQGTKLQPQGKASS